MFYFITTLRHPSNAKNYQSVLNLLKNTIESVCSQKTQHSYKFLIVCNEIPDIKVDTSKVEFLAVDFEPPGEGAGSKLSFESVLKDKGTKLAAGLAWIHQYNPSKVFIIDADDWVSRDVVEFVNSNPEVDYWHVDTGYLVNLAEKKSTRKHGLCRYCGSTYIYNYHKLLNLIGYTGTLNQILSQDQIIENIDGFGLLYLLGDHRRQLGFFHRLQEKIIPIPFKAICWILDTGENHSGKTGGSDGVPITAAMLNEFGIKSFDIPDRKATLMEKCKEFIAKTTSRIGWAKTDKTAEKV
ncbi:hypothetical protein [Paraglaciecola sp. L3A3]|uniref:hypothetical protein n=1 Tax=Paraglaciecola sp. L3A3 TaxID=2686358 RepID=UPI00131D243E|nr:hypothetical protein [Paraglaciecola sp. L3A3]